VQVVRSRELLPEIYSMKKNLRIYMIKRSIVNFFTLNSGTFMWSVGRSLRIKAGFILSVGRYPFGKQIHIWPTLDFIFGVNK